MTLQWQIQDSPDGGGVGAENCMKMKEIGPRRGALGTPMHSSTVDDKYLTSQIICLAVTPCCDLTFETTPWRHISFFYGTLQYERGFTTSYLRLKGAMVDDPVTMWDTREITDNLLKDLKWPRKELMKDYINTKEKFISFLADYREEVK